MENMTKYQFILLVLLVSFMTALVTGIVAVTLMNQAPPPITQTIQKVIERSIGAASPAFLPVDEAKQLEISATARDVLIEDIISRVSPAVVSIVALKEIQVSVGSGFFVSGDGLILTNKHVVEDTAAEYTVITNNGKKIPAKVLARDLLSDMAVLKVDGSNYAFIALGNSDSVKIGQSAITIGNALGEFQNTVSVGVVSGLARSLTASGFDSGSEDLKGVIQTDAAINPGNSGGPLLNLNGEVVGLNTAIAEGAQNIGFAIPINQIKRSLESVKSTGKIIYPFLGVRYAMVTPEIKDQYKLTIDFGALIIKGANGEAAITSGSPAEKAGIVEKDIILEFAGEKVTQDSPLGKLIFERKIGDKITIKILRDGKAMSLEATLEERK